MLTGDSVGAGWDQLERAGPKKDRQVTLGSEGPKEDRQVTLGSERWSKTNMEEQHCEDAMEEQPCENAKSLHEEMVAGFLSRWHTSYMTEQDHQVARPDMVIDAD